MSKNKRECVLSPAPVCFLSLINFLYNFIEQKLSIQRDRDICSDLFCKLFDNSLYLKKGINDLNYKKNSTFLLMFIEIMYLNIFGYWFFSELCAK